MNDRKKLEEICAKYNNNEDVRNAVIEALTYKEEEFNEYHKPVYDVVDFKKYKRHLIQLRPDVVLLLHIFQRNHDNNFESAWLDDNDEHYMEDFNCIKDSAKQLLLQLEGHYCDIFIEALRDECNDILAKSNAEKEKIINEINKDKDGNLS